jgi:hypothetical protein
MERKPLKMALGWVCFHVWTRIPFFNAFGLWLLGWAGYYAHAPEKGR